MQPLLPCVEVEEREQRDDGGEDGVEPHAVNVVVELVRAQARGEDTELQHVAGWEQNTS